jgi:Tol biopolymer transport system component
MADRLRGLDRRRAELEAHVRIERRMVESEAQFARSRRRRRLLALVAAVSLVVAVALGWSSHRVAREASRARDTARLAQAVEWMDDDPTLAALALFEVESETDATQTRMRQALGQPLARYQTRFPEPIDQIAVGPGARRVIGSTASGRLFDWSPFRTGSRQPAIRELEAVGRPLSWLRIDASGTRLLAVTPDGGVWLWDLESGRSRLLGSHEGRLWRAAFDPSGSRLVTPGEDHVARIWSLDGEPLVELRGHRHWVIDAQFDPAGRRVVTASRDGTVRVWDAETGAQLRVLEGHTSWVFYAEFSPDGERVVSASRDRTARVWDLLGRRPPRVLEGHTGTVEWAFFRPDGEQVLTSSQDGSARIWRLDGTLEQIVGQGRDAVYAEYGADGRSILFATRPDLWLLPSDGQGSSQRFGALGGMHSVDLSPDGDWLVTTVETRARLWPTRSERWGEVIAPGSIRALAR